MIVTRKCHRCGKKNRFDKTNVEGAVRCKRCGGRIRRTEQEITLLGAIWLHLKGYVFYNKAGVFAVVLFFAAIGALAYYGKSLIESIGSEDVVQNDPMPEILNAPSIEKSPPPAPVIRNEERTTAPVLTRTRRRFASDAFWPGPDAIADLSVPNEALIATGGNPARFVSVGGTVYELTSGDRLAELPADGAIRTAVSQDGKLFATAKAIDSKRTEIAIFKIDSPEAAPAVVPVEPEPGLLGMVAFTQNGQLIVQTKSIGGSELSVWSSDGMEIRRFDTPFFEPEACAIAGHANQLGIATVLGVQIYDVDRGEQVGSMVPVETGFPTSMCRGLVFSPDGSEIAALAHMNRLLVWETGSGELRLRHILEHRVTDSEVIDKAIQWLPDGRGWLINGSMLLLDDPLSIVWQAADPEICDGGYVIDKNHVLVRENGPQGMVLKPAQIPWPQIQSIEDALRQPILKPGAEVEVLVTGSDESELKSRFAEALRDRCRVLGLDVRNNADVRIRMDYTSGRGDRQPYPNVNYIDRRGRVVYPTEFQCSFSVVHKHSEGKQWSYSITRDGGSQLEIVESAKVMEEAAILGVIRSIESLSIPGRLVDKSLANIPLRSRNADAPD